MTKNLAVFPELAPPKVGPKVKTSIGFTLVVYLHDVGEYHLFRDVDLKQIETLDGTRTIISWVPNSEESTYAITKLMKQQVAELKSDEVTYAIDFTGEFSIGVLYPIAKRITIGVYGDKKYRKDLLDLILDDRIMLMKIHKCRTDETLSKIAQLDRIMKTLI